MEYLRNKVPQLGEKSETLLTYNFFLDEDSDESDTDFNNVFSREASDDEDDGIQENVLTFTLEINDRSKIEINYVTLPSDSEEG
jgi:hypothetical protein